MQPKAFTDEIRANMKEKLAWAERSLARMQSARETDPVAVQDHFWSFVHAVHLFWNYFSRWAKKERPTGPRLLIEQIKTKHLNPPEVRAWDQLGKIRNDDTHVKPVFTAKPLSGGIGISNKGIMIGKGGIMVFADKPYRVIHKDAEFELFPLCENGISAFRKLIDHFETP
jgi:hypothetical protein